MIRTGNILQNIVPRGAEEAFEELLHGAGFRLARIVSQGHNSPEGFWYQQVEAEWVIVLEGAAELKFEDGTARRMGRGDYVLIPAGVRHRVEWTDPALPTIWLAIHFTE